MFRQPQGKIREKEQDEHQQDHDEEIGDDPYKNAAHLCLRSSEGGGDVGVHTDRRGDQRDFAHHRDEHAEENGTYPQLDDDREDDGDDTHPGDDLETFRPRGVCTARRQRGFDPRDHVTQQAEQKCQQNSGEDAGDEEFADGLFRDDRIKNHSQARWNENSQRPPAERPASDKSPNS